MSRSKSSSAPKETAPAPGSAEPLTLGTTLAAAREKAGLSPEEAARILRLRPSVLRELENDDLRSFDHASYARMTLLGYARILRVPEETIRPWLPQTTGLETSDSHYLHRLAHSEQTLIDQKAFETGPNSRHPLRSTIKLFLALVILLGIGYGYVLWRNLGRLTPGSQPPTAAQATPTPNFLETLENVNPSATPSTFGQGGDAFDLHAAPTGTPALAENQDFSQAFSDDGLALDLPMALPVLPALPVDGDNDAEDPAAVTSEQDAASPSSEGDEEDEEELEEANAEPTPAL